MPHVSVNNVVTAPRSIRNGGTTEAWLPFDSLLNGIRQAVNAAFNTLPDSVTVEVNACAATTDPNEWRIQLPGLIQYPSRTANVHNILAGLLVIAAMDYVESSGYPIKVVAYTSHEPPLDEDLQPIGVSSLTSRWSPDVDLANELFNTGELLNDCCNLWPTSMPWASAYFEQVASWLRSRIAAIELRQKATPTQT